MVTPTVGEMSIHSNRQPLGRVSHIYTELSNFFKDGELWVEGTRKPLETFSFNNSDKLVEYNNYDFHGLLIKKYKYIYDDAGTLIEKMTLNADESLAFRTMYAYDPEDNCTVMVYGSDGSLGEKIIFTYDSEGKLLQRITYYPDGSRKSQGIPEADHGGVVTWKWVSYDPHGYMTRTETEIKRLSPRECERHFYESGGSLISKQISYYDSDGYEIERNYYDYEATLEKKLIWEYDSIGNVTKWTKYSGQGEIEEEYICRHDFDHSGNWIKKTYLVLILGSDPHQYRPGSIVYRTITYYSEQHNSSQISKAES